MESFKNQLPRTISEHYSISEQLYSSKYRFLYEVIQNADDSNYNIAEAGGEAIYIHFRVKPDAVVIETNEDGFNRANVEAICATGKSSKKTSPLDEQIGEKGFGFKSVFSIAHEVHIQSGIWSFMFKHREGDDGIGMVTPLDVPFEVLPAGVRTRISLRLSDTTPDRYQRLLDAINEIPETTILFLRRLRKIEATITKRDGQVEIITILRNKVDKFPGIPIIVRTRDVGGTTTRNVSAYLCAQRTIGGMPSDRRRQGRKDVKVVLAFPFDILNMKPTLSLRGQHLFAYLPLQRIPQIMVSIFKPNCNVINKS